VTLASAVNFVSAAVNLVIGLVVLLNKPQRRINRMAAFVLSTLVVWQFFAGLGHSVRDIKRAFLFANIAYSADAFMPAALLHFSLVLRNSERFRLSPLRLILLYLPSFIFVLLFNSGLMVTGRETHWWGYGGLYSKWFVLYAIWFCLMGMLILWNLFMAVRESQDYNRKNQMQYFLVAISIPYVCGAVFDISYPAIAGYNIFPVAAEATVVMNIIFAVGIIRHQLLDINIVLNRAFVYTLLSGTIMIFYLGSVFLVDRISILILGRTGKWTGAVVTLFAASIFSPLKRRIQQYADRLFYKDIYDYQLIADDFSRSVTSVLSMDTLLRIIREKVRNNLRLKEVELFIKVSEDVVSDGPSDYKCKSNILQYIKDCRDVIPVAQFMERMKGIESTSLSKGGMIVPLISVGDEILGIMLCGEKISGEPFRKEDIRLLSVLGRQAGLAIKNAMLFEELEKKKSELVEMYEKLLRNKRLATLGEISAGIAHELRNPLSIIKGAAQVLKDIGQSDGIHKEMVNIIQYEVANLECTINDFLTFASPPKPNPRTVVLNNLIKETVNAWQIQLSSNRYIVKTVLDKEVKNICVDPVQFRQVLFNILNNARDAMGDQGEIIIETRNTDNNEVEIIVSDSGPGIEEEIKERIFVPFFTTKTRGTGLGLAIVRQIVEANNGSISVESEYGKGASFIMKFPSRCQDVKEVA
jgi:signal transduction histidine kinase